MNSWANAWDLERVFTHVATSPAVPGHVITKVDLRRVWRAISVNILDTLHRTRGIQIPSFGTFTLYKKEVRDHSSWTSRMTHELFFYLDPTYEATYHIQANEATASANRGRLTFAVPSTKLSTAALQEKVGLSRTLIANTLKDIFRFVGEAIYKGQSFSLEFPGVATVYLRATKCKVVFADGLIGQIAQFDRARSKHSQRKMFGDHPNQAETWNLDEIPELEDSPTKGSRGLPMPQEPSPCEETKPTEEPCSREKPEAVAHRDTQVAPRPYTPQGPPPTKGVHTLDRRPPSPAMHRGRAPSNPRSSERDKQPRFRSSSRKTKPVNEAPPKSSGRPMSPFLLGSPVGGQLFQDIEHERERAQRANKGPHDASPPRVRVRRPSTGVMNRSVDCAIQTQAVSDCAVQTTGLGDEGEIPLPDPHVHPCVIDASQDRTAKARGLCAAELAAAKKKAFARAFEPIDSGEDIRNLINTAIVAEEQLVVEDVDTASPDRQDDAKPICPVDQDIKLKDSMLVTAAARQPLRSTSPDPSAPAPADIAPLASILEGTPPAPVLADRGLFNPFVRDEASIREERERKRELARRIEAENLQRSAEKQAQHHHTRKLERERMLARLSEPTAVTIHPDSNYSAAEALGRRAWLSSISVPQDRISQRNANTMPGACA
uniref:CCDC81 HU domain-containing protein n=1 Tax=Eutreptiella gymnastica TaxID=73025 RepID=A0A7S1J475_9EUGL|mmetsp:Transcript_65830/g.117098  ORF Transcript_65830/g.117098 Transcript_65830/m.117098 type:complete len:661 (+) Transcript_65830:75-2057(+)